MTNKLTIGELSFLSWIGNEDNAVRLFESRRWPHGRCCPECGSLDTYAHKSRKRYYHCRDCRKQFSCKVGTVMESSRIPVREWLFVLYKISVSRKSISSLQLAKDLGRPQKTTWHMLQRIKEASGSEEPFPSSWVEADEKYVGDSEFNKHESK